MTTPLPGAIQLPDGCWIRGRGLRHPTPDGPPPDFGLYLGHRADPPWPHEWLDWPDFRLPRDRDAAVRAIHALHDRAHAGERVEVACGGGIGRTGTVISCLAVGPSKPPGSAAGSGISTEDLRTRHGCAGPTRSAPMHP